MAVLLGLDTGGTYTDAVLHDEDAPAPGILAKAKSLTTKEDLSLGIGAAVDAVLQTGTDPASIGLVSISTTLATNALVEGQGGRICLLLIGFEEQALSRAGLGEALGADPVAMIAGGHSPSGARQAPLDRTALREAIDAHADNVDAFAVIGYFAARDPEDEIAAKTMIQQKCTEPVTCGHELASGLNGPKRAVTAVLNARLIGMISDLITSTEAILARHAITAPLMIVRGDGSLVSAAFARDRPIETILSGPAASLIGAAHLTQAKNAVVSDIGGTTTDIAILEEGRPALSPDGARVGVHHTMVEAVGMTTHGLGGDSETVIDDRSLAPRLILGPRRLVPLCIAAAQHPAIIHKALDLQLGRATPGGHDARFLRANPAARVTAGLSDADQTLLSALDGDPRPAEEVLQSRMQIAALRRLVSRGLVHVIGFTPTDAAHVLGGHVAWDAEAARKGALLMARKRDAGGRTIARTPEDLARMVHETLVQRSSEVLLDAVLRHDGLPESAAANPLARAALGGHRGTARVDIGLALPLVGLGASAPLYYPDIAAVLGTDPLVPDDADVANAIGAVVGRVRITLDAVVTQPSEGRFRVHLSDAMPEFNDIETAERHAAEALRHAAREAAGRAGAGDIELTEDWQAKTAVIEGREMFIEGQMTVTASGRPRLGI